MESKYCVIGGGPLGIAIGKALEQGGIPFDLYEREDDFGGTWYFGTPSSFVYTSAHLISSKANTQFSDHPMPREYPEYPRHDQFLAYLREVATRFGLYEHAHFGRAVESIEPAGSQWRVRLAGETGARSYRGVLVANGRLRKPIVPVYSGRFDGEVVLAQDYRSPEVFKGKRVLVVGGGNSGCDIAVAATCCAARVLHSTRRAYHYFPKFIAGRATQDWLMALSERFASGEGLRKYVRETLKLAGFDPTDYGLPAPDHDIDQAHPIMNSLILYHIGHGDIAPKPDIRELRGRSVVFEDGSTEEVDLLLYATGYDSDLPFLRPEHLREGDLYMRSLHKRFDNLAFFGYINAASGFGNLANVGGRFLVEYLRAYERDSEAFRVFRAMKHGPEPDFGEARFVKTDRHRVEVDLWRYLRALNLLTSKLAA